MSSRAFKLLERMRRSKAGWKRKDIDALYEGFGFIITHGKSHDKVKHPDFPHLRDILTRRNELAKFYISNAVKLVDELIGLKAGKE